MGEGGAASARPPVRVLPLREPEGEGGTARGLGAPPGSLAPVASTRGMGGPASTRPPFACRPYARTGEGRGATRAPVHGDTKRGVPLPLSQPAPVAPPRFPRHPVLCTWRTEEGGGGAHKAGIAQQWGRGARKGEGGRGWRVGKRVAPAARGQQGTRKGGSTRARGGAREV